MAISPPERTQPEPRIDPQLAPQLARLGGRLAAASRSEARHRRRLERLVLHGADTTDQERRLDQAVERVVAAAREIETLVAEPEDGEPVRPLVDASALTASDDDPGPEQSTGAQPAAGHARARPRQAAGPRRSRIAKPIVAAAIDVGSNSVHLLVAVVRGHRLEPLLDISAFLGLGHAVDERGELGPELRGGLVDTLRDYVGQARTLGAERLTIVATDPLRRARDGAEAAAAIEAETGLRTHVVGHDEEAYLTLLGVTAGRPVVRDLVLVDIGGGSSEVLVVGPAGKPITLGLPIGSARLTARIVEHDPPSPSELEALLVEARAAVAAAPPATPQAVILVGGTASNLLRIVPAAALDRTITRRRLAEALAVVATQTAAESAARHGIREARAKMMPAGAAIVGALLERYAVERARVSEAGIREGAVLAAVHGGDRWRDDLAWLAHGWSQEPAATTRSEPGEDPSKAASERDPGNASPRPPD